MTVLTAAALLGGCTSIQNSTTPSQALDLTGIWRGNFAVQTVTSEMLWTLTQNGTSVTGPVLVRLPNGIVLLNGYLRGTLAGSTLTYTISVGPEGIPSQPACVGRFGGSMTAKTGAPSTLTGAYAVTSTTCAPPFASSGDISLALG